jgi:hypothetical protein
MKIVLGGFNHWQDAKMALKKSRKLTEKTEILRR